jgi:hypothetical protein
MREAFPAAKLVGPDVIAVVGFRFCDRDRADRMVLIRGPSTPKAITVGLMKTLHVLFDVFVFHRISLQSASVCGLAIGRTGAPIPREQTRTNSPDFPPPERGNSRLVRVRELGKRERALH